MSTWHYKQDGIHSSANSQGSHQRHTSARMLGRLGIKGNANDHPAEDAHIKKDLAPSALDCEMDDEWNLQFRAGGAWSYLDWQGNLFLRHGLQRLKLKSKMTECERPTTPEDCGLPATQIFSCRVTAS